MHVQDNEGFQLHEPSAKKIHCIRKNPVGIHECWSGDRHNKLYKIGFPIVDDATGKWLAGWVIPSNRLGFIIGYLYLCTVEKYGGKPVLYLYLQSYSTNFILWGVPLQFTTDCGSKTTQAFGYGNALRFIMWHLLYFMLLTITTIELLSILRSTGMNFPPMSMSIVFTTSLLKSPGYV